MHKSARIELLCDDDFFRGEFAAKLLLLFQNSIQNESHMSEKEMIEKFQSQDFEGIPLNFFVEDTEFTISWNKDNIIDGDQKLTTFYFLVLQLNSEVSQNILENLKKSNVSKNCFYCIIDKLNARKKQNDIKKFQNELMIKLKENPDFEIDSQNICSFLFSDDFQAISGLFQTLCGIVNLNKLQQCLVEQQNQIKITLNQIAKKYQIQNIDSFVHLILSGQTQQALESVKNRKKRKQLQKEIQSISIISQQVSENKNSFELSQNSNIQEDKQHQFVQCQGTEIRQLKKQSKQDSLLQIAKKQLLKILELFDVKQERRTKCLEQIINQDLENAQLNIKKSLREDFVSQCNNCVELQEYFKKQKQSSAPTFSKDEMIKLLDQYVVESEQCFQHLMNDNISLVLEQIKVSERAEFQKKIGEFQSYQNYLLDFRKQNNQSLRTVAKTIEKYVSDLSEQQRSDIGQQILEGNFSSVDDLLPSENFPKFVRELLSEDFLLKQFEQSGKIWESISELYFYPTKSLEQFDALLQSLEGQSNCKSKRLNNFKNLETKEKQQILRLELKNISHIKNEEDDKKLKVLKQFISYQIFAINQKIAAQEENYVNEQLTEQFLTKQINVRLSERDNILVIDNLNQSIISIEKKIQKILNNNSSNQDIYFSEKQKLYKAKSLFTCLQFLKKKNSKKLVSVSSAKKQVFYYFQNKPKVKQVYAQTTKIFGSEIILEFEYENEKKCIMNLQETLEEPISIKVSERTLIKYKFNNKISELKASKSLKKQSLIQAIKNNVLSQNNIQLKQNKVEILVVFDNKKEVQLDENSLQDLEMINNLKIDFLIVDVVIRIIIFYEGGRKQFFMKSNQSIHDLKEQIQKEMKIPIESQKITNRDNQNTETRQLYDELFANLSNEYFFVFELDSKMSMYYYGFHKNYPLQLQDFSKFYIQKDQDIDKMIEESTFKQNDEKNFFMNLIKHIYSAMKRKFPFSLVTDEIKRKIVEKTSNEIWTKQNFTNYFILYYMLYNAEEKLKIQLINVLRTHLPLPLYFRQFHHINDVKDEWKLNNELLWFLHEGTCITSIGLHSDEEQKRESQTGKTFLNNHLFYTEFQQKQEKHPISFGCPQIVLKSLGSVVPINIVDIPSDCPEQIANKILRNSNVVIVHSWKNAKDTEEYVNKLRSDFKIQYIITLIRDHKNSSETIVKVKKVNFEKQQICQIHSMREYQQSKKQIPFLKILKQKVWLMIQKAHSDKKQQKDLLYRLFESKLFDDFQRISKKLKEQFYHLGRINEAYSKLKEKQRIMKMKFQGEQQYQEQKKMIVKKGIHPAFSEAILFIDSNTTHQSILMLRLREVLKEFKNQEQKKFYKIDHFKAKIGEVGNDKESFLKIRDETIRQLSKLPFLPKIKEKSEVSLFLEEISKVLEFYQNEIKPKFFTIELVWRQLQYLVSLDEKTMLGEKQLLDILINLKRKQIQCYQPFEFLDGDLLEMPKSILKKSFEGQKERIVVITTFGPQSSGKSTLLNFLFGCDFGTSEGRCTKGVYGTFFKFSNLHFSGCDGIFLVDTQGLFANVSKKDASKRKDFDSKLVLFCLAISDFVIINTKGNLDNKSTRILESSWERFEALTQENIDWPQIFLVLNQNTSGNTVTSGSDINNLREILKLTNSFSLNQAYKLTEISKKDLIILPQIESFVKKEPRAQFLALTNKLQKSLLTKIKEKQNFKQIATVIDQMQKMWSTIEAFPDLGRNLSKKLQFIEKDIKQWKMKQMENISNEKDSIITILKKGEKTKKKCEEQFSNVIETTLQLFSEQFLSKQKLDDYNEEQKMKIELEKTTIQLSFRGIQYQFVSKIKAYQKDRLAQKCKTEGSQSVHEQIRKVKQIQAKQKRKLTDSQKIKFFDQAFQKSLDKIRLISLPQNQLESYFQQIREYYQNALQTNSSQLKNGAQRSGIPKCQWKRETESSFENYSHCLKQNIKKQFLNSNNTVQYRKNPPTIVLDENGKTDAKLNYFNMRKYFQKNKERQFIKIYYGGFKNSLKTQIMKQQIREKLNKEKGNLRKVFEIINAVLFKKFKFSIMQYSQFQEVFRSKGGFLNFFKNLIKKTNNLTITKNQIYQQKKHEYEYYSMNTIDQEFAEGRKNHFQKNQNPERFMYFYKLANKMKQIKKELQSQYNSNSNNVFLRNQVQNTLHEFIKWQQIKNFINQDSQFQYFLDKLNYDYYNALNQQLNKFGLQIQFNSIFDAVNDQKFDIKSCQRPPIFETEQQFFQALKALSRFDGNKIKRDITITTRYQSSSYYLYLGCYESQKLQVKSQYVKNKFLKTYISEQKRKTFKDLDSQPLRNFLFDELQINKSFSLLLNNIKSIIQKSNLTLTKQGISGIYIDVINEIKEFNNDINQVSHKLTLLFTGYVHMYAIYLIWKKLSDKAIQQANKPYKDLLATKDEQRRFFLLETSDDNALQSEAQSQRFFDEMMKNVEQKINEQKLKIIKDEAQYFKQTYTRQKIQEEIDRQCFDSSSKQEDWMNYLMDPAKVIEEKYQTLRQESIEKIKHRIPKIKYPDDIVKQVKEIMDILFVKMKGINISEGTSHTQIFGIENKSFNDISITDSDVREKVNMMIMEYFLDLVINDPKDQYQVSNDFSILINNQYVFRTGRQCSQDLKTIVTKIREHRMRVTELYTFCYKLNQKFYDIDQQKKTEKVNTLIQKMLQLKEQERIEFENLVQVKICKEKCPGCQRICGVSQHHTNGHQCLYGHQMRAIGNVKINNGDASVIRCEDVHLLSLIQFNGREMTWKQFKKKEEGSWKFDDINGNTNKQKFVKAWNLVGQKICQKYGFNFVLSNQVDLQKISNMPVHYIFAIDQSGSMSGKPWSDLMSSLNETIDSLIKNDTLMTTKVSILPHNSHCRIHCQNVNPINVNRNVTFKSGGNNFSEAFRVAYSLMKKYIEDSIIRFVFMTDGYADYPGNQIQQIKLLKSQHPNKIQYYGIQFNSDTGVMKMICQQLQGSNSIATDASQLKNRYKEIIQRNS